MISRAAELSALETIAVGGDEVVYAFVSLAGEPSTLDDGLLDDRERARAARLRRAADRGRFVLAHAALRSFLARCLGVVPTAVRYENGVDGKPALAADLPPLEFNLSHSGDVGLLAVARDRPVGVDVERVRDLPDALAIAETHFSPAEQAALRSVAPPEQLRAFFRCWTRKEAVVKAAGEGLARALDTFDVDLASESASTTVRVADPPASGPDWCLRDLPAPSGYEAAVAVAVGPHTAPLRWREFSIETQHDGQPSR